MSARVSAARASAIALTIGLALCAVGCPKASRPLVFGRVDEERQTPLVEQAKEESPALWQKGEGLRAKAEEAFGRGDLVAADLYGQHAIAAYEHAVASGRLQKATGRKGAEADRLARALERLQADEASRVEIDAEADKLEGDISVRREALVPATSGPTDPAREAARWVAVRVNVATAEALCTGAELLAPKAKGIPEARKVLADVSTKSADGKGDAPIDASTRARALCLKALTNARDVAVSGGGPTGDVLLSEIAGMGGYDAIRDERGVVATLSEVPAASAPFEANSSKLTKVGKDKLDALGRVSKSHPGFAILVVVHDAPGQTNTAARDKERAEQVKQTLAAAGADVTRIGTQLPGTQLPAYDPADAKTKAKNERVEVVFVGGKT